MRNFRVISVALLLILTVVAAAKTRPQAKPKAKPKRDFALWFQAIDKHVRVGTVPKFRLTVKNESGRRQRILSAARDDLQSVYYELVVTRKGKTVELSRGISDPGGISDSDYIKLASGARKSFIFSSFPILLEELEPGAYEAHVLFWNYPDSNKNRYKSQSAKFSVYGKAKR